MEQIEKIDLKLFNFLENKLIKNGADSDKSSFLDIKNNLNCRKILSSEEFALEAIYVILASGFRQQTAKKIFLKISTFLETCNLVDEDSLFLIFKNKAKNKAIVKIWKEKDTFRNDFYDLITDSEKLDFLEKLPYIGKITKNHIARNLGIDIVKYDIWIQKIAVCLEGDLNDCNLINNQKLNPKIQLIADLMFTKIIKITGEKRGYIDVVLWKSCEQGLLKIENNNLFLNRVY